MNDRAVGVITKENKMLLMWRYREGKEYYTFPGGSIEEGEDEETGLRREMFEELNLEIRNPKKVFTNKNDHGGQTRLDHLYLITEFSGEIKLGAPELTHQHHENIFRPEWIPFEKLEEVNLLPVEEKEKIIAFMKNSDKG